MANPEEIDRRVAGTVMERMIPKDSPNQRNGVLASLGLVADTFEMLPTIEEAAGRSLVITEWARERQGWLFITSRPTERDALKPIISLWLRLADSSITLRSDARPEARLPRHRRAGESAETATTTHRLDGEPQKQEPAHSRVPRQRPDGRGVRPSRVFCNAFPTGHQDIPPDN